MSILLTMFSAYHSKRRRAIEIHEFNKKTHTSLQQYGKRHFLGGIYRQALVYRLTIRRKYCACHIFQGYKLQRYSWFWWGYYSMRTKGQKYWRMWFMFHNNVCERIHLYERFLFCILPCCLMQEKSFSYDSRPIIWLIKIYWYE